MPERPLTFYVVTRQVDGQFVVRRLPLDDNVQAQLTAHFLDAYETDWKAEHVEVKRYADTMIARPHEVMRIQGFTLTDEFKRAVTNPQHFDEFSLPVPAGETIKGIFGCRTGLYLFQVCDSR